MYVCVYVKGSQNCFLPLKNYRTLKFILPAAAAIQPVSYMLSLLLKLPCTSCALLTRDVFAIANFLVTARGWSTESL